MANSSGTDGDDFFHIAGDGHTPPSGYNDIDNLTNDGDWVLAKQGNDIVYAGSGDDQIYKQIGKGNFTVHGGAGNDNIYGASGNDDISGDDGNDFIHEAARRGSALGPEGGTDTAHGGAGNDVFLFAGTFDNSDSIDGGSGHDIVRLNGAYDDSGFNTPSLVMGATTMTNVEVLTLHQRFNYKITTADATVAAGAQLLVDGTKLGGLLTFIGSAETDGHFVLRGGAASDVLTGGLQGDRFTGNGGGDYFTYTNVAQSASALYDRITDFNAASDKFDLNVSVSGIDATQSGHLSVSTLDANLAAAFTSSTLAAHHAALFDVTTGGLSGHTFLVVDANGNAGYQAHDDYVFDVTGMTGTLNAADFI